MTEVYDITNKYATGGTPVSFCSSFSTSYSSKPITLSKICETISNNGLVDYQSNSEKYLQLHRVNPLLTLSPTNRRLLQQVEDLTHCISNDNRIVLDAQLAESHPTLYSLTGFGCNLVRPLLGFDQRLFQIQSDSPSIETPYFNSGASRLIVHALHDELDYLQLSDYERLALKELCLNTTLINTD